MSRALLALLVVMAVAATPASAQQPTPTVGNASVSESAGVVRVDVTLAAPRSDPVDVTWRTGAAAFLADAPGALAGVDYVAGSGTLTFAPGETTKQIAVTLIDNALDEYGRYFAVFASEAPGPNPPPFYGGLIEVLDDDPTPAPSIADASAREDAGQVTLQVTRPAPTGRGPMRWAWTARGGTATLGRDLPPASGIVALAGEQTAATISIPLIDDDESEPDETVLVELTPLAPTNPWGQVAGDPPADGMATVTIHDDDDDARPALLLTPRTGAVRMRAAGRTAWSRLRAPVTARPGTLVDARRGTVEFGGARLSAGVFIVRSAGALALAGGRRAACGHPRRSLIVRAGPALRISGRRATTSSADAAAHWTIADGCRGTSVHVLRGRVTVTSASGSSTLRRSAHRLFR